MKTKFLIVESVYKVNIHCYVNYSWDEMRAQVKKDINVDLDTRKDSTLFGTYITADDNDFRSRIMWIKECDWTVSFYSGLAHEMVHIAVEVLDSRGVVIDPQNDEPLAYLTEFFYEHFCGACKQRLVDNPKKQIKAKKKKRRGKLYEAEEG